MVTQYVKVVPPGGILDFYKQKLTTPPIEPIITRNPWALGKINVGFLLGKSVRGVAGGLLHNVLPNVEKMDYFTSYDE